MNETPNLLVDAGSIVVPLLVVGAILKKAFPKFPNQMIPLVTLVGGMAAYVAKTGGATLNDWVQALLISATATGIHSGVKNVFEKNSGGASPPTNPS